ncbi:MAG: glucose/arabinose dehydrogenase [Planctomycetota bacterium]|jgi:glucose/arabinose dehydrogenase
MKEAVFALFLLMSCPLASGSAQTLYTERVAFGLAAPGYLAQAPGDNERLFILERRKGIRIVKNGVLNPGLYLDIRAELDTTNEAATCFAFHPDYQNNGRVFILYMDIQLVTHLAQYTVSSTDPEVVDPNSRVQILGPIQQPSTIHNWDCIKFGPDGMLYVSTGDGVLVANNTDNNSQDLASSFGKILRIDVDILPPYIPNDNPFVGQAGADEHVWIYGVRQPWRFAFDSLNGDLYIADVGKQEWEEIDVLNSGTAAGKNMGWRCLEGNTCTNFTGSGCLTCGDPSYVPPALTYFHDEGRCAIIGGEVYRGTEIPELYGDYFYADFCSNRFWSFKWDGAQVTEHVERTADLLPNLGGPIDFPTSFGVDNAGEIYILSNVGGEIYKIVSKSLTCNSSTYCAATLNSSGTSASISSTGSTSMSANDFVLSASGVLPNKVGLFFYGSTQIQVTFGDGFRCVGGGIWRLNPAILANASGTVQRPIDLANPPSPGGEIAAGSTWNFQYWYRDSITPGLFNLSNGLEASFCP